MNKIEIMRKETINKYFKNGALFKKKTMNFFLLTKMDIKTQNINLKG